VRATGCLLQVGDCAAAAASCPRVCLYLLGFNVNPHGRAARTSTEVVNDTLQNEKRLLIKSCQLGSVDVQDTCAR
jgi:hypothetical protein